MIVKLIMYCYCITYLNVRNFRNLYFKSNLNKAYQSTGILQKRPVLMSDNKVVFNRKHR